MPLEVGQTAADYEILEMLGKGGMGRVYRVRNVISNRVEAMKVLLADVAAEAGLGDRFIGEIRTLARLDHPNIAKFHTAFKIDNQLVMVMEFVEGFTLADRAKQGPIPLPEVLSYATQILAALSFAHGSGVIHRDIKPSNVMVTPHGVVKLMDFGIAKSNAEPLLTRPGTTMGSMLYMSPEQVRGASVDARSDLYSVGVLLYELTSGKRPFEAENTYAILEAQLNTVPKPPFEVNPALPKMLSEIIMTALAKEPMHRFQNADAFRRALENVKGPSATSIPTVSAPPRVPPPLAAQAPSVLDSSAPRGRRGLWMALGAAACVFVLIGAAVTLPHFWRSSASTKPAPQAVSAPNSASTAGSLAPMDQVPGTPAGSAGTSTASSSQSASVSQQNQEDNARTPPAPLRTSSSSAKPSKPTRRAPGQESMGQPTGSGTFGSAAQNPAVQPQPIQPPKPQEAQSSAPSQEEMDKISEELMKLHARSDAVRGSLENLKQQQAAAGVGLRQDMRASASRLDAYLQAADRAVQGGNPASARKNMDRAEEELSKLENFFGR